MCATRGDCEIEIGGGFLSASETVRLEVREIAQRFLSLARQQTHPGSLNNQNLGLHPRFPEPKLALLIPWHIVLLDISAA